MTAAERAEERARNGPVPGKHGGEAHADIKGEPQPVTPEPAPFEAEVARALADVHAELGTDKNNKHALLFSVDAASLLGEELTAPQWLVTRLITRGGTAVIGGLPKAAKKTWLATEIAVAVATDTKVCGESLPSSARSATFYAEDTRRQIRNRIRALLEGAGRTMLIERLYLEPRGSFLDVTRDEDLAWIVASCRRGGKLDLLVLDRLRDIDNGEEDKSDSMRDVMRRIRLLGELLGCTVLVVHHAGKPSEATAKRGGGQRLRGSGSIDGSVDSGIYFLDCNGDGVDTFKNTVESEIKGARSAGIFTLALQITDDDSDEAVRATWEVSRDAGAPKPLAKTATAAAKRVLAAKVREDTVVRCYGWRGSPRCRLRASRGAGSLRARGRSRRDAVVAASDATCAPRTDGTAACIGAPRCARPGDGPALDAHVGEQCISRGWSATRRRPATTAHARGSRQCQ